MSVAIVLAPRRRAGEKQTRQHHNAGAVVEASINPFVQQHGAFAQSSTRPLLESRAAARRMAGGLTGSATGLLQRPHADR